MKTIKLNESQLRKMIRKQLGEARGLGMQGVARHDRQDPSHPGHMGSAAGATMKAEPRKPGRASGPHDPKAIERAAKEAIKALYGDDAVLESDEEDEKDVEAEDED